MVTGITYDLKWKTPVRQLDDGGINQCPLNPTKSLITLVSKHKHGIFGKELS